MQCLIEGQPRTRLLTFSKKTTNTMLIRDKLISQVLDLYIPSLPQESHLISQPHCLVNPFADDVLDALAMKNDIKFLSQSVIPLMRVEEPPRL